ncbi:MAG: basic secretory family protein [Prevotellaceae bacterium]|jgi:hypothetical protein|nr:basic secretory family protein [Prevotellaceae bacterium]
MRNLILIPLISTLTCNCLTAGEIKDSTVKDGYTLVVIDKSPDFDKNTKTKLCEVFFQVYPQLVNRFNKNSTKKVVFVIDPEYKGVAATFRGRVVFCPDWFKSNPEDIDVVTHEVMHIVQNYGRTDAPGWITEGIADYVRYKYGVANEKGNWRLPEVSQSQSYTNSYRITARFFAWLENHKNKNLIDKLDETMRNHKYSDSFWKDMTSKTIDELWKEYLISPTL